MSEKYTSPSNIEKEFPYKAGDRPHKVPIKIIDGELISVGDVYQVIEVPKGEKVKVIERAVSGCCILKIESPKKDFYFHMPPAAIQTMLNPSEPLTVHQTYFRAGLKTCSTLTDAQFTYFVNGFHANSAARRLQAAKQLHETLFPNFHAEYQVIVSEEGETYDLFKSIDMTFQEGELTLPKGYFLVDHQ